MDPRFTPHNRHRDGAERFFVEDPHLRRLLRQPLVHESRLLAELPCEAPGIYTLGGGRQVGKTTLLKQWMASLLRHGTDPTRITFLTGELIPDEISLLSHLQAALGGTSADSGPRFVLVDEVTYIKGWERGVKFLADAGELEQVVLMLTGSDLKLVREARVLLPGRRGRADIVDFHLHPLSWLDASRLLGLLSAEEAAVLLTGTPAMLGSLLPEVWERAYSGLDRYLMHGGYLTAMNDVAREGRVLPATFAIYSDWIRGDVGKRGKSETWLREILSALLRRPGSQLTWNALAKDLSIDHPATVADYVALLESMDVLFVQPALLEHRLVAAPKKARKVQFLDPFVHHAVRAWLDPSSAPWEDRVLPFTGDPESAAGIVEASVASHARRQFPTFYIKAEGEVDLAIVAEGRFWPIEVKWRRASRPKDLKQIAKYKNGVIAAPVRAPGIAGDTPVVPLPVVLARLAEGVWAAGAAGFR